MSASYRLPDEPRPGPLSHLVVNPMWPLLAVMFGGVWLSWPWFLFNGWALGSPTRLREALVVGAGIVGSFVLVFASLILVTKLHLPLDVLTYLFTTNLIWKLGITYLLAETQGRGFGVYQYYGGTVRNGILVAIPVAFFLRPKVVALIGTSILGEVLL